MATVEHVDRTLGSAAATEMLYRRHGSRVLRYCLRCLRKPADAEDALQQTFLQAHRALGHGVEPVAEATWLLTIARNVCLTRVDALRRRARVEFAEDPSVSPQTPAPTMHRPSSRPRSSRRSRDCPSASGRCCSCASGRSCRTPRSPRCSGRPSPPSRRCSSAAGTRSPCSSARRGAAGARFDLAAFLSGWARPFAGIAVPKLAAGAAAVVAVAAAGVATTEGTHVTGIRLRLLPLCRRRYRCTRPRPSGAGPRRRCEGTPLPLGACAMRTPCRPLLVRCRSQVLRSTGRAADSRVRSGTWLGCCRGRADVGRQPRPVERRADSHSTGRAGAPPLVSPPPVLAPVVAPVTAAVDATVQTAVTAVPAAAATVDQVAQDVAATTQAASATVSSAVSSSFPVTDHRKFLPAWWSLRQRCERCASVAAGAGRVAASRPALIFSTPFDASRLEWGNEHTGATWFRRGRFIRMSCKPRSPVGLVNPPAPIKCESS